MRFHGWMLGAVLSVFSAIGVGCDDSACPDGGCRCRGECQSCTATCDELVERDSGR